MKYAYTLAIGGYQRVQRVSSPVRSQRSIVSFLTSVLTMFLPCLVILTITTVIPSIKSQESFNTSPPAFHSNFSCDGQPRGFYADKASKCRVYHICDDQGNKFTYHCPEATVFRQEALICDHEHLVDCENGVRIGVAGKRPSSKDSNVQSLLFGRPSTSQQLSSFGASNTARDTNAQSSWRNGNYFGTNGTQSLGLQNNREKTIVSPRTLTFEAIRRGENAQRDNFDNFRTTTTQRRPDGSYHGYRTEQTRRSFESAFQSVNKNYRGGQNENSRDVPETTPVSFGTSEIPLRDITASLKPLVPNTLEYDPYYPRGSTTTEAYQKWRTTRIPPPALEIEAFGSSDLAVDIEFPNPLPDSDTFQDLVDRRRLFYIPKSNS